MSRPDVIIIGGGIAGLSAAALLAPKYRVLLLEREPLLASVASGNNAAIYRPLEHDALSATLAVRSRALLDAWVGPHVLQRCGLLLVSASCDSVADLAAVARQRDVAHEVLDADALRRRVPVLQHGELQAGLWLLDGGVLDLHVLTTTLAQRARAAGAELRTSVAVAELVRDAQHITGVQLTTGERIAAGHVVLAAGAYSAELARSAGLGLPLTALRRHLVQLRASVIAPTQPVVWRLEEEVYFRPESGGVLASPCDETVWSAEIEPRSDPAALLALAQKLERTAPALATATVQRAWACLRTFAPDRELVIGADPRVEGLSWLAGLGGRGMSVALAAAEILTESFSSPPQAARYSELTVERLV